MKNSNKAKRFWTLNRHHAGGFTLVELIVVIAILAILAGVAVPAYSGYVAKTNKQADISLAGDVAHALELAFYNQKLPEGGMVVLTKDGVKTDADSLSTASEAALEATFGSVANIPGLKFNGWNGDYDGGSFQGKEIELLGKVEDLTDALGSFLEANQDSQLLMGGRFGNFMKTELGFSGDDLENEAKVADAAVLYVADVTTNLNAEQQKALENIGKCKSFSQVASTLINDVYDDNLFAGTAAAYALLTGYCHANNITVGELDVSAIGDSPNPNDMLAMLEATFAGALGNKAEFNKNWAEYAKSQAGKDAAAFMEVMGTVSSAKGLVVDNLGNTGCYTSAEMRELVANYAAGNIVVRADVKNGMLDLVLVPATLK